jgi:hypothetical protein
VPEEIFNAIEAEYMKVAGWFKKPRTNSIKVNPRGWRNDKLGNSAALSLIFLDLLACILII